MNWPVVNLAEALESAKMFTDGDWVESKDQDPAGDVRLIQLADVGDGEYLDRSSRFLTSAKARALRCTFLMPSDILVARMPDPLGRACIFPDDLKPAVTVVDVCIIRTDPEQHDPRWLMHCLNAPMCRNQIARYATGTTRSRISRGNLRKIRVPFPPLLEQRRIARMLDKAHALRAKRRATIAQLDTLTQSIFLEKFGDPATNPKRLPTTRLGNVCTRITDGTHQPPKWSRSGNPFLFVSNIISGELTFDTQKLISDETHAELTSRCPIDVGDVLYSTVGSYGVPAVVKTTRKFAFQRHIAHLKPERRVMDPEFLRAMLASPPLKRQADQAARGVAQKTVNLADLREFVVFRPPLELQRDFTRMVTAVGELRLTQQRSLAELDVLVTSLQHSAFNGDL